MSFLKRMKVRSLTKKATSLCKARQTTQPSDADVAKEIALHYKLAEVYEKLHGKKKFPYADLLALECYRNAASLEDAKARYILAQRLIERGKFWDSLKRSAFACNAHTKYAKDTYEEAFAFLKAAEEQGHALAKRLHGLAYINGWGVEMDRDLGFKLVIESIEQENAFDRATQIFQELGLNKPEFFSYMMTAKKG